LSTFTSPLIVKIHTLRPQEREIFVPFTYITNAGSSIVVPKGFFTNFASTPKFLWFILPPLDHYGKAAVVHDYLYRSVDVKYSRSEADLILKEACEVLKVKPWKTFTLYWGVRLFGWWAWNRHRN